MNFSHHIGVLARLKGRSLALCINLLDGVTVVSFFLVSIAPYK